jgi:hypothetical protein
MKILKCTGTQGYLEKMEVGENGNHLAILTPHKSEAMQFDSDLKIRYFVARAGFRLEQFEIIEI